MGNAKIEAVTTENDGITFRINGSTEAIVIAIAETIKYLMNVSDASFDEVVSDLKRGYEYLEINYEDVK